MGGVVLVHGAFHDASCWSGVVGELVKRSVPVTAVELPLAGLIADVAVARAEIEGGGPGSVVVGHSYGGAVISAAASGLSSVRRLVYLAALMTDEDEDPFAMLAHTKLAERIVLDERGLTVPPEVAIPIFYGDTDAETAALLAARLRPMQVSSEPRPNSEPAWRQVPSTYVVCTNDQAIPALLQRQMAEHADAVIEWPTDHSPFITRPGAVAELLMSYLD